MRQPPKFMRRPKPRRQEFAAPPQSRPPKGPRRWSKWRGQLLEVLARRDDLAAVDADFAHLFSSWFNRGFLVMRRIDWSTPAVVLEKIIRYEAVHQIRDWDDLRAPHRSAGPALATRSFIRRWSTSP